eukprot:9498269-Pyramimonas_sp.AAC.1
MGTRCALLTAVRARRLLILRVCGQVDWSGTNRRASAAARHARVDGIQQTLAYSSHWRAGARVIL